jgi:hypothetical protein
MTHPFAAFLLDAAAWIAPPHRRQWIEGLRAEAAVAAHSTPWAWGALTTALQQRLIDMVVSGQALRLVLSGFVVSVAVSFAVFVAVRFPNMEATAIRMGETPLLVGLVPAAIVFLTLSGGLAILLSAGRPWFNRYGRALFGLGGLYIGFSLAGTVLQPQVSISSAISGAFFVGAALALLLRRIRLFLAFASGALALEIAHYAVVLPHRHLDHVTILIVGFFNVCTPGLLLLAGGGLLIPRRTPAAA